MIHSVHGTNPAHGGALLEAAHRQRQLRPPQHRLVGQLRPGHRERAICPPSSRSARRWPTAASTTGARRSCRPSTRARRSATPASRPTRPACNTSPTPRCRANMQRLQLDRLAAMNREHLAAGRPGAVARSPHQFVRAGLPHADRAAAGRRPLRRIGGDAASCTASTIR